MGLKMPVHRFLLEEIVNAESYDDLSRVSGIINKLGVSRGHNIVIEAWDHTWKKKWLADADDVQKKLYYDTRAELHRQKELVDAKERQVPSARGSYTFGFSQR